MTAIEYAALVDDVAARIMSGELKPGDRLPPQRAFAYDHGIAASTATRVYSELLRRGLVIGEVGRGTFVARANHTEAGIRGEPHEGRIDLEFNFPTIASQSSLISKSLTCLQRPDVMAAALSPVTNRRIEAARTAAAAFMVSPDWQPPRDGFVFTGSGRQSIAAAIAALVPVGGRIGVEAITYPMIKGIAARLGVLIVPIGMDVEGPLPDQIAKAHRSGALSAIYIQPALQNPLGHSISPLRRAELLKITAKLGLIVIEDIVYGFLADDPPLAALAPDRCIVVDSLSKRIAPGIAVGLLHVPNVLRDRVAQTVRTGAWQVSPLGLEAAVRLLSDGTAAQITQLKRDDARLRQQIVAKGLPGIDIAADPRAYHAWIRLPAGLRSEAFAAAALRAGIAITPSSAFAMAPGHAPNAVRIALGLPTHAQLREAMSKLASLLRAGPNDGDVTE